MNARRVPARTGRGRRRVAVLGVLAVVVTASAPGLLGGSAGAGSVAGEAGTDTSLPTTDSAVTVSGRGEFSNLKITVNQTRDLVNQAVSVSWTGGAPTYTNPTNQAFSSQFVGNYLQVFECWGDPQTVNPPDAGAGPEPTQCEFGGESATPTSSYPIPEAGHEYSRVLSQPGWGDYSSLAGAAIPGTSLTTWVDNSSSDDTGYVVEPFQAVDGTVVDQQADYNYDNDVQDPQPFWLNSEFSYGTTNEVDFARTYADGTGQQIFQVDTGQTASGLGCGQDVQPVAGGGKKVPQCWLVVVPRSTGAAEDPSGALTATQSVVTSPLTPEAWAHRIAIPLSFNPVGTSCSPSAPTDEVFGSELASTAFSSWEPGLCQAGSADNYQFVSSNDTLARGNLTDPQYGSAGMSVFSDPVAANATSSPVVYSPLTLSGVVVAFNIDRVSSLDSDGQPYADEEALAGSRVEHLYLTPRLMAKLLTESYQSQLQNVTTDKSASYAWVQKNPVSLFSDPDFLQYNPEFAELTTQQKIDAGTLVVEETSSDSALAVWKWILADKSAREWLSGVPDPWGMNVNPYYSTNADENPNGLAFDDPVPNTFPKNDPYCYNTGQEVYGVPGQPEQPARPLCLQDWSPFTLSNQASALAAATANDGAKTTLDPSQSANTAWVSNGPQESGGDCVMVITDSASAAQYGLQTASLSHAGDDTDPTFVAPTSSSILAGEQAMSKSSVSGVVVPNADTTASGAYPLPMVTYGATTPATLTPAQRSEYAALVDYAATTGQVPGTAPGNLPEGYVPLPADLVEEAKASATSILNPPSTPAPAAPATPTPTPSSSPTYGSGDQFTVPTATAPAALASFNPLGTGATSGTHGRKTSNQLAVEKTGIVPIGAIRWILPLVLLLAILAASGAVLIGRNTAPVEGDPDAWAMEGDVDGGLDGEFDGGSDPISGPTGGAP